MRWALAALALGVLSLPATAQTGQPRELLTNGGFEDGLADWQPDPKHELITAAGIAHGGGKCIAGEITAPNTHLTLSRRLELKAGAVYTLSAWSKGTNETKLVVWRSNAAGQRVMVVAFEKQTPQWRRYESTFSVETSEPWTVEFIAPSSHGAPAGRLWLDDVSLTELDMPAPIDLSEGQGFNDWPRMAKVGNHACAAWVSFRDGADTLQVAQVALAGGVLTQTFQVAGGAGTYILDPWVVADGEGAWVLYATEVGGDWEIMAARVTASGVGAPVRVTSRPGADVKPKGVAADDALCVVWEASLEGTRQVMAAWLRGGKAGRPRVLSNRRSQSYEPCAAA
ncbi:MAG: hypothetical protein FJX74_12965, partial [Armatimonadetes bacterium]|nr:hypothetical protein [Armatimonadota bacterium]